MATDGSSLYIGKEDRAFYITSEGKVAVLINETESIASSTSGKNMAVWQGKVYYPCGTQSLVEYDAGVISWLSPAKFCSNLPDFTGCILALTGDEEYLIAIIGSGTKVRILFGREESILGTTKWVWHPYQELSLSGCEIAFVVYDYQKRLYIGSTSTQDGFYYIPLPIAYGDIDSDVNRAFATGGYFITPKLHANFKGDNKAYIKVIAALGHTYDVNVYFECWYRIEDGSWTNAGDIKGSATSRIATLYFPANTTSHSLQLKFIGKTNDTTKTPILLWYNVRAILYAPRRNIISCVVRCADGILDKQGALLGCSAKEIKTWLEAARDATYPIAFKDIDGEKVYVRVLPTSPFSRVIRSEKGRNLERHFNLLLETVAIS
jgi:hypothetical protein